MPFYFDRLGNLRLREFDHWPWLIHGFSTRSAGNLQPRPAQDRFARSLAGPGAKLVTARQIHSAIVRLATDSGRPGDSLVTAAPGILVGIKTADCLPILLANPRCRVVAAVHAGWCGAAKRVVEKTIGEMRCAFGSDPADLHAAIGPGIQACCFEVGPEVLQEFASQFVDADQFCRPDPPDPALTMLPHPTMTGEGHALMRRLDSDHGRVDLAEAVRRQLLAAGVSRIYNSGLCTACDLKHFYSYRREKEAAGRMLAVIGVRLESSARAEDLTQGRFPETSETVG